MEQLEADLAGAAARLEADLRELAQDAYRERLAQVLEGLAGGVANIPANIPAAPSPRRREKPINTRGSAARRAAHNPRPRKPAERDPKPAKATPPPATPTPAPTPPPPPVAAAPPPAAPTRRAPRRVPLPLRPEALATSQLAARQRLIADRARRLQSTEPLAIEALTTDDVDAGDVAGEEDTRA